MYHGRTSDEEKIRGLETKVNALLARLDRDEGMIADLKSKVLQGGGGGQQTGPGRYSDILVALTPGGGIPFAVFDVGPPWTLTPGVAECQIGRWLLDGSFEDSGETADVFNDYTSTDSVDIAGDTIISIGTDNRGRLRVLGEPC